jgi:hypothetical protein
MQADRNGKKRGEHGTRERALRFFSAMTTLLNMALNGKAEIAPNLGAPSLYGR